MLVYPTGVDLSTRTLRFLTDRLNAHRRERGTRWRRLPADRQALLVLAHLRRGHTYTQLAAGFGIGVSTATALVGVLAVGSGSVWPGVDGVCARSTRP
uniref:transposase family protein n=1 Tax=Parafrankia discariae TaxID=365528 RepID=UPI001E38E488